MAQTLRDFIDGIGIVDVHEHHIPEILLNPQINLVQLFQQSYAGWTQSRPYPLPSETRANDPMLEPTGPATWKALAPFLEQSGTNSFVRNLVSAITELHGAGENTITRENWERLDAAVRQQHQRPDWCRQTLRRAGIERLITDPYTDPLLDARSALGDNYHSVVRINSFACAWHAESRDHNGNNGQQLLRRGEPNLPTRSISSVSPPSTAFSATMSNEIVSARDSGKRRVALA